MPKRKSKTLVAPPQPSSISTRARIDGAIIDEVARLVARQLSESEACRLLNIIPETWFSWKARHRHDERFAAKLESFRAKRIDGLLAGIESAVTGANGTRADWRAGLALLKIADNKRFGDAPVPPPPLSAFDFTESMLARMLARAYEPKALPAVECLPPAIDCESLDPEKPEQKHPGNEGDGAEGQADKKQD